MSIDEISARLAQRFEFLRSASRTAPDRHRTLRAVIDWSWDLLDDEARQALRRLCRFPRVSPPPRPPPSWGAPELFATTCSTHWRTSHC